jgi:hypothetical protein
MRITHTTQTIQCDRCNAVVRPGDLAHTPMLPLSLRFVSPYGATISVEIRDACQPCADAIKQALHSDLVFDSRGPGITVTPRRPDEPPQDRSDDRIGNTD